MPWPFYPQRLLVLPTVWSSTSAAIGVIAELMNVPSPLSRGVTALDVIGDCGWGRLAGLLECNGSADVRVSADDCD